MDLYGDPAYSGREPGTTRYMRVSEWLSDKRAPIVLERMRALYAAEVTMTDHWIGFLIGRLRELALETDTVIVLVADHGHLFGEHGWTGKISSILHPELVHVPLIIVDPRAGAAQDELPRADARHRPDAALARGGPAWRVDGRRRPVAAAAWQAPARRAQVRLRRLRQLALRPHAGVGVRGEQLRVGRRLYDLERDPKEEDNIARRHRKRLDALDAAIRRRAGERIPVYH